MVMILANSQPLLILLGMRQKVTVASGLKIPTGYPIHISRLSILYLFLPLGLGLLC